jgi:hypothetical protein
VNPLLHEVIERIKILFADSLPPLEHFTQPVKRGVLSLQIEEGF